MFAGSASGPSPSHSSIGRSHSSARRPSSSSGCPQGGAPDSRRAVWREVPRIVPRRNPAGATRPGRSTRACCPRWRDGEGSVSSHGGVGLPSGLWSDGNGSSSRPGNATVNGRCRASHPEVYMTTYAPRSASGNRPIPTPSEYLITNADSTDAIWEPGSYATHRLRGDPGTRDRLLSDRERPERAAVWPRLQVEFGAGSFEGSAVSPCWSAGRCQRRRPIRVPLGRVLGTGRRARLGDGGW